MQVLARAGAHRARGLGRGAPGTAGDPLPPAQFAGQKPGRGGGCRWKYRQKQLEGRRRARENSWERGADTCKDSTQEGKEKNGRVRQRKHCALIKIRACV